jgi:hypothetical protein
MSSFTRNQKISIVFGLLGLAGTIIVIYFQFFYSSYGLRAVVSQISCDSDTITIPMVIINTGNREAAVLNTYPTISTTKTNSSLGSANPLPSLFLFLKPGEMKPLILRAPFPKNTLYDEGFPPDEMFKPMEDSRKIPLKIFFHTMDGRGYEYRSYSNLINIHIDKKKGSLFWDQGQLIFDLNGK